MRPVVYILVALFLQADASYLSKRRSSLLLRSPTTSNLLHPKNEFSTRNLSALFHSPTTSTVLSLRGGSVTPTPNQVQTFLNAMDLVGTVVFAFSGALTAGKKGMDLLGMIMVATVTSCGGGTLRDLVLDSGTVFWMEDALYLQICIVVTLLTYFLWPTLEKEFGWHGSELCVCTADAVGLAAFAVLGAQKAASFDLHPLLWVVSGLMSACFGGVIRDLLCLQQPRIMYPYRTLYGPPAILGSAIYAGLVEWSSMETHIAASVAFAVTFVARVMSFNNPRRLPHWSNQ